MFAHISLGCRDLEASLPFYDAVMAALGYGRLFGDPGEGFMAYGPEERFFIICRPLDENRDAAPSPGTHLCFRAASRAAVDAFHRAALDHGGTCDGPPGLRPHYAEDYYAAFVRDPDGHKLEAVANR